MEDIAELFKGLSDKTRLRIMLILVKASSKLCVCEIIDSLHESQYNVSRHLKVLRSAGLVREERDGRWVFYSLASPQSKFQELILQAIASLPEECWSADSIRLEKRLTLRKDGKCVVGMKSEERGDHA